ncbi:hypothetical protein [Sulfitobacter sp. 1A12157]|uniref:glycine-rich domain-containing protein n=1 Tax=Sulfitobacter sp. 1A12157 TaxID=3368594 RepID=UPI0037471861
MSDYISAGSVADYQEFLTSGTWTKPEGVSFVYVEAVGGGGGGGNHPGASSKAGGSGGEGVSRLFLAADVSSSESIVIGAGGLGTANGAESTASDGGSTSMGSLITASGGYGGNQITPTPAGAVKKGISKSAFDMLAVYFPHSGYGGAGDAVEDVRRGGATTYGGGGGGGANSSYSSDTPGGVSKFAGNGGSGSYTSGVKGGDGQTPGGGGGGSINNGGGGDGAPGRVRVWSW